MNDLPWGDVALNLLAVTAAVVVFIGVIMATAIRIRNQSIIDIFWGPGFVLAAVVSYLVSAGSDGDDTRRLVVLALTSVWGLRLGLYIGNRNRGHGQDKRYTALMRHRTGSLVGFLVRKIYGLQGFLILLVSLPVQVAMYESEPLGVIGAIGIAVWAVGFAFEAVGDWQLARFKADPANSGRIMDRGLWAWTRHPNYFGDAAVWTGLFLLALGSPWGLLTIVSPIVMTKLLVSYSGKALLERGMRRSKGEAYDLYVARTSGFLPLPPRRTATAADGARA
jgi:steroid 5-alpha reductase family enzyme